MGVPSRGLSQGGRPMLQRATTWQRAFLVAATCALLLAIRQLGQCPCPGGATGGGGLFGRSPAAGTYSTHEVVFARQRAEKLGSGSGGSSSSSASGSLAVPVAAAAPGALAAPAAPAAPAPGTVDLSLAHMLLPLTNLTNLTTAGLLDAVGGNVTTGEARALMRLHQDLYCSAHLHQPDPVGSARANFGNVSMSVYAKDDIVSQSLRGPTHTWETQEMQDFLYALRAPVPSSAAELPRPASWRARRSPFIVDIGANIGWFMLNAAAAGGTVAAFEAMSTNIRLLRASMCNNPWLMDRIALYGTGLGTKRSTCYMISGTINTGDGHTLCDQDPVSAVRDWKVKTGFDYEVRGQITTMRLDSLVDHDVQVLKIDVEGFETPILQGGEALFKKYNVWFIMAECNKDIIKEEGQIEFVKFMDKLGYYMSSRSFKGPFLSDAQVRGQKPLVLSSVNLFCVKKELRDAVVRAGGGRRGLLDANGNDEDDRWAAWLSSSSSSSSSSQRTA